MGRRNTLLKKEKIYKVELARRLGNPDNLVGGLIWEAEWIDITEYFHERLDTVNTSLDDQTLQGKLEQSSTSFRFDNVTGKFNPESTENSFWEDSGYIYHSRIRYWEYYADEDIEATGKLPLLDGLIAEEPRYRAGMLCDIRVNSKLDILREHYLLEVGITFNYTASSTGIISYIGSLFTRSYSELGVVIKAGVLKKEIIYENITPYSDDLLSTFNRIVTDGGGYGGLTRANELFSAYHGATLVTQTNFEDDADCISLYLMDATDYAAGVGTTIYDQTATNADLTTVNTVYNNWITEGFFNNAVKSWYRSTVDAEWTDLTNLTIELLIKGTTFGTPRAQYSSVGGATKEYSINPLVVFSNYNVADIQLYEGVSTYNEEGLYYWNSKVYYMQIQRPANPNWVINTMIELGPIAGENFIQYLAFVLDSTTNELSYYLNGKLKKYLITPNDLGLYYTAANIKVMGRCFSQYGDIIATGTLDYNDEMISVYYHSMKFSDTLKTEQQIFEQHEKLIGVDFIL